MNHSQSYVNHSQLYSVFFILSITRFYMSEALSECGVKFRQQKSKLVNDCDVRIAIKGF